jgi:hypothetical protein
MLVYNFIVHNNDANGIERLGDMALASDGDALAFARLIIRDLMREGAGEYAGWTMEVAQDERDVADIPFGPCPDQA